MDYSKPIEYYVNQLKAKLHNVELETEEIFRQNSVFSELALRGVNLFEHVSNGQVITSGKRLLVVAPNLPKGVFNHHSLRVDGQLVFGFALDVIFYDNEKVALSVPSIKVSDKFFDVAKAPTLEFPDIPYLESVLMYRTYSGKICITIGV